MNEEIGNFLLGEGASLFAVADISKIKNKFRIKENILERFDKAVCFGVRLSDAIVDEIEDHPTQAYYHHYRRVNILLDNIGLLLSNFIQNKGFCSYPVPASLVEDWQKQTASVSHKHIAVEAGLGWLGRNNLLVTEKFGSRVRFASVLTDAPLTASSPLKKDCGNCKACVAECPAGAIKMEKGEFDHIACFEKLKEFRNKGYTGQFICGVCLRTCLGISRWK